MSSSGGKTFLHARGGGSWIFSHMQRGMVCNFFRVADKMFSTSHPVLKGHSLKYTLIKGLLTYNIQSKWFPISLHFAIIYHTGILPSVSLRHILYI